MIQRNDRHTACSSGILLIEITPKVGTPLLSAEHLCGVNGCYGCDADADDGDDDDNFTATS